MAEMIREALIATLDGAGRVHLTPLGFRQRADLVVLAPYHPSQTLQNLRACGYAVLNFTDDVRIMAGCLTGHREWPTVPAGIVPVPRLAQVLAHWELQVVAIREDAQRPEFDCRIVAAGNHAAFTGYNRAQAAVVEAAILVTRLDWLEPDAVAADLKHLRIAVEKTAGERERIAWDWLCAAVAAHPRHAGLSLDAAP